MQKAKFILLTMLVSCSSYQKHTDHENHVIMITSRYIDLDIETIIDVKCADFEGSFSNFQTIVIKDSKKINQILSLLRGLKPASKNYYHHVDTRIKLELKYINDSIETICMDRFIVSRNNSLLINTDSLKYLLTRIE